MSDRDHHGYDHGCERDYDHDHDHDCTCEKDQLHDCAHDYGYHGCDHFHVNDYRDHGCHGRVYDLLGGVNEHPTGVYVHGYNYGYVDVKVQVNPPQTFLNYSLYFWFFQS